MNEMRKPVFIVDRLGTASILAALRARRSARTIFYLHRSASAVSRFCIKILERCGWSFETLDYSLYPVNGRSPYKEVQELLIAKIKECRENIFSGALVSLKGISEYERRRLATYFGRFAGVELYLPLQIVAVLDIKRPFGDRPCTVFVRKGMFFDIIDDVYKKYKVSLKGYSAWGGATFSVRKDFLMDKYTQRHAHMERHSFVRMAVFIIHSLVNRVHWILRRSLRGKFRMHRICVLAFNAYATPLCNCMPWGLTQVSSLKEQTLSLYYTSLPASAKAFYRERSETACEYGFHPFQKISSAETIRAWSCFAGLLLRNLFFYRSIFSPGKTRRWMRRFVPYFLTRLSFFEALFGTQGAKVLWTMNEDDSEVQIAAVAMRRCGGVSLGTTWSQTPIPVWTIQHNQHDIYFLWGNRLADIRKGIRDECESFIISGYPADDKFEQEFQKAQVLRARIRKDYHAGRILTFFDNISANDTFVAPQALTEIYRELFAWLDEDRGNFLILKAKHGEHLLQYSDIKSRVDDLSRKGRMLVIGQKSALYPGLASDAVIGISLTLPILAALLGRPVLVYDMHSVTRQYPTGLSDFHVVGRAQDIRRELNRIMQQSQDRGYPEKMQVVRGSCIDPFLDGKAADRIRGYIESVLRKLTTGASSRDAITHANAAYTAYWGKDTITEGPLRV